MNKGYSGKDSTTQWQSEQDEWAGGDYELTKEIPDWASEEFGFGFDEFEDKLDKLREQQREEYERMSEEIRSGLFDYQHTSEIIGEILELPKPYKLEFMKEAEKLQRETFADQVLEEGEELGEFLESVWEEKQETTKIGCDLIVETSYELGLL